MTSGSIFKGARSGYLGARGKPDQPPPTATTISRRSPLASGVSACWLRGTISPFFSMAMRFPASSSDSISWASVSGAGKARVSPLMSNSITKTLLQSGEYEFSIMPDSTPKGVAIDRAGVVWGFYRLAETCASFLGRGSDDPPQDGCNEAWSTVS